MMAIIERRKERKRRRFGGEFWSKSTVSRFEDNSWKGEGKMVRDTALDGEYQARATTREERPRFPLRKVYDPFTIDTTVQRK